MARRRDRIVAWVGVIVAGLSAIALSGAVIIQQVIDNHNASQSQYSSQTATASQGASQTCADTATEQTVPAPAVYTPSGTVTSLQSSDLTVGTGAATKSGDCVVVKYYGTLASNGKEFDEDFSSTAGLAFTLGAGQVIPGWDQGLVGMKVGGTRQLVIPASLAYGNQSPSPSIPANASLVFVVKLLRIQNQ